MEDSTLLSSTSRSPMPAKTASRIGRESLPSESQSNPAQSGDWRPISLTRPVLLTVLALSLLLFACIEYLAQRSQNRGGLLSYPSIDDIPSRVSFAYRYLPTIVATLFSLLWNWIDLDVKRAQPWIELSKPKGATAESSILLDYSTFFLPFAPIRAARLRQWPVFFSGTAAVLILWVLTPLQTVLLGNANILHTRPAMVTARSHLIPPSAQTQSSNYISLAYAIGSRNALYPAFTTSEYALLPFYLQDNVTETTNRNWTAETTKLWAEVDCTPIEPEYMGEVNFEGGRVGRSIMPQHLDKPDSTGDHMSQVRDAKTIYRNALYRFTGSRNCSSNATFEINSSLKNLENSYPMLVYRDSLNSKAKATNRWHCPSNVGYSSLIYWANPVELYGPKPWKLNITALQCGVSYYKQQVTATVDSKTLLPIDNATKPISDRKILSSAEFNNLTFMRSFPMDNTYDNIRLVGNYTDLNYPVMYQGDNGETERDVVFRYALILQKEKSIHAYSDSPKLEVLFRKVQQQFFSLGVSTRLSNETSTLNETANSTMLMTSIIVSRPFSIASEVLLLLSALVLGVLCYFMRPSVCVLDEIPASIGGLIDIAHKSPSVRELLRPMDTSTEELMTNALGKTKLHVAADLTSRSTKISIMPDSTMSSEKGGNTTPKSYYKPIKPWILRRGTGAVLVAALVGAVVVLSYFKATERKHNGLQRPSKNFEVLQLLENYIPTAFSTLVEPFWILLARTMCTFQPFKDLWKGQSPAGRSIDATYTSVPPQLALLKTMIGRKFLLFYLCLAAFLANVLAIGLSALFNEKPVAVSFTQQFRSPYQSRLNSSMLNQSNNGNFVQREDPLFMTLTNMTYDAKLSIWTSAEYYFQPMDIVGEDKMSSSDEFTVRTRGFGVDVNCTSSPRSTHRLWFYNNTDPYPSAQDNATCAGLMKGVRYEAINSGLNSDLTGAATFSAFQIRYWNMTLISGCPPDITAVWAKAPGGLRENNTVEMSSAHCRPTFQTAMFDTTVNREGNVIRYKRVSAIESDLNYSNSTKDINFLVGISLRYAGGVVSSWYNTSYAQGWYDQFIYEETGSRDSFNPDKPVTDSEKLLPYLESITRRLLPAYMGNFPEFLLKAEEETTVTGTRATEDTRIFMENTAFIITMVVLGFDLIVALAFYLPESLYVLPRLPSSVGSIIAYVAPSRAVKDGTPSSGWGGQTFSFGRYIGYDGKSYVGVEMDPHVAGKDVSLGSYKPLLPRSFKNNPLAMVPSAAESDRERSN